MRQIDADALIADVKRLDGIPWGDDRGNKVAFLMSAEEMIRLIEHAPTTGREDVGDNISRQAAIDALCKRCDLVHDVPCTEECNDIKILRKLPSTDRRGEWLKNKHWSSERWEVDYKCSECGYITVFTPKYVPFCPQCGADMRGGKHE